MLGGKNKHFLPLLDVVVHCLSHIRIRIHCHRDHRLLHCFCFCILYLYSISICLKIRVKMLLHYLGFEHTGACLADILMQHLNLA